MQLLLLQKSWYWLAVVTGFILSTTDNMIEAVAQDEGQITLEGLEEVPAGTLKAILTPLKKQKRWKLWETRIPENYTEVERPGEESDSPVIVNISMTVTRIHSISESDMSFGLDVYFREEWTDERLKYIPKLDEDESDHEDGINIPAEGRSRIWHPDTYFSNAIKVDEEATGEFRFHLILYPSGSIWYSRKISISADCPMIMTYYPFDSQGCSLKLGSYSNNNENVVFQWKGLSTDAVQIDESTLQLPEFKVLQPVRLRHYHELWSSGNYSQLQACWALKRSAGFCLVQLIIPAASVVLCSWVALWLEEEATFSDIISVVLAIIFLSYSQNSMMPRVSYIKLMDLYFGTCFAFTFFCLVKLVILKTVQKRWERKHLGSSFNETLHQASWEVENVACTDTTICITKFCHILTQLLIPIAFGGVLFTMLFIIPTLNRGEPCWKEQNGHEHHGIQFM